MLGITRRIDSTGRLSIPSDFRHLSGIGPNSVVELSLGENNTIIVKPHIATCVSCGNIIHVENFGCYLNDESKSKLCKNCLGTIKEK